MYDEDNNGSNVEWVWVWNQWPGAILAALGPGFAPLVQQSPIDWRGRRPLTLSTSDCHRAGKRNTIGRREQGWEKWKECHNNDRQNRENVEPLIFCTELALKWFAIKSCKSDEDCFTCKSLKQLPIPHYCKVDHCVRTPLLDFHFFFLVMSRVGIHSMINIGNNQIWTRSRLIVRRRAFNKEPSLFRNHSHAPQSR